MPPADTAEDQIFNLYTMVKGSYSFSVWRQCLIAGLIAAFIILYLFLCRAPTLAEWLISALIIAVIVYFTHSWLWTHFFYPNGNQIEKGLLKLKEKIEEDKSKNKKKKN